MGETWRNRIIDTRMVPAEQLHAHPDNWRTHPDSQASALRGLLAEVGIVAPLIAYESERYGSLTLIDGHLRRDAGGTWPVTVLDVSDEEADLILATFDPITGLAEMDTQALADLLGRVEMMPVDDAGVQALLEQLAEESGKEADPAPTADAEPQVDRAEELRQRWGVESGQLWQLGDHRLICGDCTDADVVARVMGGERAILAPVDPPYNVGFAYDGETVDDRKVMEEYERFSRAWFGLCRDVSDRQIVTPGCNNLALWLRWFDAYHWGSWIKTNSMTNGRVSRFWCWEPVLFFGEHWGKSRHSDVFDYPIGQQKDTANHPCPKPLKMWCDLIENYSEPGDVIFESFSGSGTTIIACEQLGRKCRAIEISPAYVAVALQRWADATGREPVLTEAG